VRPPTILDAWREARQAWPGVVVGEGEFADWVRARREREEAEGASLAWHDLYLACACARGDPAALAAFDATFLPEVDKAVKRIRGSVPPPDEVRQVLRERLFVAQPGGRPKIAEYSGRGPLRTWVRMAALRTGINLAIQVGREVPFESDALTFLVGTGDDPELGYLKRVYTSEFRAAFDEAFGKLDARERSLLRYAFGEGLSVDAVGGIYGVHRATAARWIAKAHETLVDLVKKGIRARLAVSQMPCPTLHASRLIVDERRDVAPRLRRDLPGPRGDVASESTVVMRPRGLRREGQSARLAIGQREGERFRLSPVLLGLDGRRAIGAAHRHGELVQREAPCVRDVHQDGVRTDEQAAREVVAHEVVHVTQRLRGEAEWRNDAGADVTRGRRRRQEIDLHAP